MNDVLIQKINSIHRCIKRAREEHAAAGAHFSNDYTRQDAAVLNLIIACEQSIDLANYLVKKEKLGVPSDSADSFDLLEKGEIISPDLSTRLKKMIGFRNTVVHEYQSVNMKIVEKTITDSLADILQFTDIVLPYGK